MKNNHSALSNSELSSRELSPERIADLLTLGTAQLDTQTTTALQHARASALARQSAKEPALIATAGHWHFSFSHSTRQWMMLVLLVAIAAAGAGYWQNATHADAAHLDMAILTDDMPLEVFLDQ